MADLLSIVHELQQFPDMTPRPKRDGMLLFILNIFRVVENRMASRSRRKKIRAAAVVDPIRVAYVVAYISPATVKLEPPECDLDRLRTFFYKVCELIANDANFVEAVEILNDMKLALQSHVEYYKKAEYDDFQRILTEIETKILPVIQLQTPTFDVNDLQADIGYIQMLMKRIYMPPVPCEPIECANKCENDTKSDHSSERAMTDYTHESSSRISRMIVKVLTAIIRSINLPDVIRYTQTFITHIEKTYYSNISLERLQDKLVSMIGNINHGVNPIIIKMRVDYIKDMLEKCNQS